MTYLITKRRYFDYLFALGGYLCISLIVMSGILFSPGTIGFFHDWFIGPYPEMNGFWAKNGLYVWDSQIGNKLYDTDWIFRLTILPLAFVGGESLSKGLLVVIITLSGFSSFCLGKRLNLNPYVSFLSGIMYVFSPVLFTRIAAGYMYYLVAYALSPVILQGFLKGKDENKNKYFIVSALLLSFATIQLQFLVMLLLILVVFSLVDIKRIRRSIIGLLIISSITILITFSPILLAQLSMKNAQIPFNPTQLISYFTVTTASDLAESFRLLGYEGMPYSYLNLGTPKDILLSNTGIIPPWIFYLDFVLPIVGFSVLFFRRDKYAISLAIVSLIGLFLLKGTNPPLSQAFVFLFTHGLYIFREVWHLAFLYGFSITFLAALLLDTLVKKRSKSVFSFKKLRVKITTLTVLSIVLVFAIVVSNGYPLLLGNFAGYVQTYRFPDQYHSLYDKFLTDSQYNVLILPYVNPIRYDNLRLQGLDPLITDSSNMIFPTILGNRMSSTLGFSTWLITSMQENMTNNLGKLLSGFGIKYVILRNDFVSNYPDYTPMGNLHKFREKWYTPLKPFLDSQKDMKSVLENAEFTVYQNMQYAAKVFTPSVSAGGLTDFDYLLSISTIRPLSEVALYQSVSDRDSFVFLDSKEEKNMTGNDFMQIGNYATAFDSKKGWTNNILSFGYDHALASRTNEGLFSAAKNSLVSFQLPAKYINKNIEVWAKALVWEQGGKINVQTNANQNPVFLFSPEQSFRIYKVFQGKALPPFNITMENIAGWNYVEGFYINNIGEKQFTPSNAIFIDKPRNQAQVNLVVNSNFSKSSNASGLPLNWNDPLNSCRKAFTCRVNNADGWQDNGSFQLSTKKPHNLPDKWSYIYGQPINVNPQESFKFIIHMKLNQWATQSHVVLEGFNETSRKWSQIEQCPSGTNGPFDWDVFSCYFKISEDVTKIRPVLNAGWSSEPGRVARTWFDDIYLYKITGNNQSYTINEVKNLIMPGISVNGSTSELENTVIKEYTKIDPANWNLHIKTQKPTTIAFAEPYDEAWKATVYKDGKAIENIKSTRLYGSINSFQIKQTGALDISLKFERQHWYETGLVISGVTILLCILFIVYDYFRVRIKRESKI